QLSVVAPNDAGRFENPVFRAGATDLLIAETPAHVTLYIHWLDKEKMETFKSAYNAWMKKLTARLPADSEAVAVANLLLG
ncbi:MAG: hypothetical protein GY859_42530, partial [Desulfobacterales bacterium]|nr:hypothetical protein [Desulfobacterales bacterium]